MYPTLESGGISLSSADIELDENQRKILSERERTREKPPRFSQPISTLHTHDYANECVHENVLVKYAVGRVS